MKVHILVVEDFDGNIVQICGVYKWLDDAIAERVKQESLDVLYKIVTKDVLELE